MTNREKMLYYLKQFESWQATVKEFEDEALKEAEKANQRSVRRHDPEYIAAQALVKNFWYNKAVAKRNSAQAQAQMYGLAALVDATPGEIRSPLPGPPPPNRE